MPWQRLVPGGGFHQVAEGLAGQAVHVFQAVGVFEGAAGQRAGFLQARHAVLHDDG